MGLVVLTESAAWQTLNRPITDDGVAVGVAPRASVSAIVIQRQEVRPVNAVSVIGALLQSTIARLT